MTAIHDAYLATDPLHYWPLDEVSGTTAADLVSVDPLNGTCSGMVMGGNYVELLDVPRTPMFTGVNTEYIHVKNGPILGGTNEWSVVAWVGYNGTTAAKRAWYGESSAPFSHDLMAAYIDDIAGGSGPVSLSTTWQADTGLAVTIGSYGVYFRYNWTFVVITRNGATVDGYWNLGHRLHSTAGPTGNTWTESGVLSRIGLAGGNSWPFKGGISNLAIYDRAISLADQRTIYEACRPLTRNYPTRTFFAPHSPWRQRLTDPANPPTINSAGAADVTKLQNQAATFSCGANASTGPFWSAPPGTPTQRVRLAGGQQNIAIAPLDLWNSFGTVPLQEGFTVPLTSDRQGQVYSEDTDEIWEFIQMEQTLTPPNPPYSSPYGTGTLAAGTYAYAIVACLADDTHGQIAYTNVVVNGAQGVYVSWKPVEGCHHFRLYRNGPFGPGTPYGIVSNTIPSTQLSFIDPGIQVTPTILGPPDYHSTDWGCSYGGHMADTDNSTGFYPPEHNNWGSSASGALLWAGAVSLAEGFAGVIPHAISMGLAQTDGSGHVYPALRNDGTGGAYAIKEGTRFQLDPTYDISQIPFTFERAVAKAMQDYGAYHRDTTMEVSVYVEDQYGIGRDLWTEIFQGRYAFELFDNFAFPWDRMRVIDPAWTQLQVVGGGVPLKMAELVDRFALPGGLIDPVLWPARTGIFIGNERAHIPTTTSYPRLSTDPNIYDLSSSEFVVQVLQVPVGHAASEAGLQLYNAYTPSCYIEMVWTDNGKLVCGYNSSAGIRTRVVQPTYDAASHVWWRIRHSNGNLYWDTSVNGTTWTQLGTVAWSATGWDAPKLGQMIIKFFAGNWQGHDGNPDFVFDNINVPSSQPPAVASIDLPTSLNIQQRRTELVIDGD